MTYFTPINALPKHILEGESDLNELMLELSKEFKPIITNIPFKAKL